MTNCSRRRSRWQAPRRRRATSPGAAHDEGPENRGVLPRILRPMAPLSRLPGEGYDSRQHFPRLRRRLARSDVRGTDPAHHASAPDGRARRRAAAQRCDLRQRPTRPLLWRRHRETIPSALDAARSEGRVAPRRGLAQHWARRPFRDAGHPGEERRGAANEPGQTRVLGRPSCARPALPAAARRRAGVAEVGEGKRQDHPRNARPTCGESARRCATSTSTASA